MLDIGLPGMDGCHIAASLKRLTAPPFIIAVTGYGQQDDKRRAYEAGVDLYLLKPADPEKLMLMLARFQRLLGD